MSRTVKGTIAVVAALVVGILGFFYYVLQTEPTFNPQLGVQDEMGTNTPPTGATMERLSTDEAVTDPDTVAKEVSITVSAKNFSFNPKTVSVKKGATVKITFKDTEGGHDFALDEFGVKTKVLSPGQEETVTFVADQAGTFEYYCSVGFHRQMGMVGTFTVTE